MKTKFPTTSSVKRKKSLQLLGNNVESLLKDLEAEKEGQGLRLVSRAERSGFTEALVGVIYSHVIEDSEHQVKAEGLEPDDPQCNDVHVAVRENVKNILVLLGWWSDTQVGNCCDRVLLTLNCLKSQPRDTQEYSDVHNDELPDANIHPKHYVKSRLRSKEHVTSRPCSKDHVDSHLRSKDHVDSRLRSKDHVDSRLRSKDHVDSRLRSKDHVASRPRSKNHVDSRLCSKDHVASRLRSKDHVDSHLRSNDHVDSRLRSKDHVDSRLRSKDHVASRPRSKNHVDSRLRSKDNVASRPRSKNDVDSRLRSKDHVASCLRSKDHVDAVILSDHEDMDASLYNSEYANVSAHHEHEEVLLDYFDDKDMMLAERKKHKTFIYLFIELLVWKLVKQAKNFGHDTETVIQRLSEATWINLEGSDPSLFEPNRLNGLKNQVYKKLCKEFGCAENLLFHLSLNDEAVQDCTVAIISSQLKMQKKPSMATKFVSWLKRVFTGCCR
ncbi:hypothetical protein D4764_10G0007480 [Takifugu flavidus]|uniref:Uncharacterized protein n=1 Tax=Takifugu flavidus TaxID=433684 RepID=A0A5C6PLW8_9TELE|nr:hypothetical protein D4764_10G0007480 [Takifugu flavidus]